MKISIKEICLIIITLCFIALLYNRWNIGKYSIIVDHIEDSPMVFRLLDTKTGTTYETWRKDRNINTKTHWKEKITFSDKQQEVKLLDY